MSGPEVRSEEDASEPRAFEPGTRVGRYTVARRIGSGAVGVVYEAVHQELGKRVAIKVLRSERAAHDATRARFVREGLVASRIRHPHVVDVVDVGEHDGRPYLVMELLEGEPLGARIARGGPLPAATAADLMVPVVAAVAAAHEQGVVHRDLKPENIVLARVRHGGGNLVHPKVVDFGISKVLEPAGERRAVTSTANIVGTPMYMAPEQVQRASAADARSDQYALGVILYECVTGTNPFRPAPRSVFAVLDAVSRGAFAPPRAARADVPLALEAVILRAMALAPAARYASLHAFGRALLPFASERVRAHWSGAFAGGGDDDAGEDDGAEAPPVRARAARARSPRDRDRRIALLACGLLASAAGVSSVVTAARGAPAAPAPVAPVVRPLAERAPAQSPPPRALVLAGDAPSTRSRPAPQPAAAAPSSTAVHGAPARRVRVVATARRAASPAAATAHEPPPAPVAVETPAAPVVRPNGALNLR